MLDACSLVPARPSLGRLNCVAVFDPRRREFADQKRYGQVFCKAAAVINFHRVQRVFVAMRRTWLLVMLSMHCDDLSSQDLATADGRGQRYIRSFFHMLGRPLAYHEATDMCQSCAFPGLVHDTSGAASEHRITFAPREVLARDFCSPAQASEFRGVLGLVFTGAYGKVGRGGQSAWRLDASTPTRSPSLSVARCAGQWSEVLPTRGVEMRSGGRPPIVVASDGRADDSGPPTSVLVHDLEGQTRIGVYAAIHGMVLGLWGRPEQPLADVEEPAIIAGTMAFATKFHGRSILWFEDKSVALASLVKGSSSAPGLDQGTSAVHLMMAALVPRV